MKIIEPSTTIETPIDGVHGEEILRSIEAVARVCYKSEEKITPTSAPDFVRNLVQVRKHESVMEHRSVTVRFIVDRGVSHELVRHRLASYSQESTRYCNYSNEKFGEEITVIRPCFWEPCDPKTCDLYMQWKFGCEYAEKNYFALLKKGASPQQARSVLPNSLKTEIVMTANLREWRHVLALRCSTAAHPQMRQVMLPLLRTFKQYLSPLFEDIPYE